MKLYTFKVAASREVTVACKSEKEAWEVIENLRVILIEKGYEVGLERVESVAPFGEET